MKNESKVVAQATFRQNAKKAEAGLAETMFESKDDKSYLEDVVKLDDVAEE